MSRNLVIVESPAKAKTIQKYLGPEYEVLASYGHVRDLVPKDGAVDPARGFAMKYQLIERNEKHVREIIRELKHSDALILATDPDREGEAIAWHLLEVLREKKALDGKPVQRVVFYEITPREVKRAIHEPRDVATPLVEAQQTRRALDYLVGFNLSPLLWRKVAPGLSAGRVQSPALRLICERELEIRAFEPQEYWTLDARAAREAAAFTARLVEYDGHKVEQFTLGDQGSAQAAVERIGRDAEGRLRVEKVEKKQRRRTPGPPFTTSTLQQEANRRLGFTASRTMRAAQQLFEGIEIDGQAVGLITYMRTDSVHLAQEAVAELRRVIGSRYGAGSVPDKPNFFKTRSKNAQEAHEAIRPTSPARLPEAVVGHLSADQAKLYALIWKRAVASQMTPAIFDTVTATLRAGNPHAFRATGQTLREAGFLAAWGVTPDAASEGGDEDDDKRLPPLEEGESLSLLELLPEQHFTQPPPRYTEASLVKTLEEYDIGRPSTYATIISTLQARDYVQLNGKAFVPTDVGMIVNRFLTEHFTRYVDYKFTARLEDELDAVSRGEAERVPLLARFWRDFKPVVDEKMELKRSDVAEARLLGTDPATGKPVTARLGRYGPFVQIGTKDDAEKPRFASLRGGQRLDTITLEAALELFKLPRKLGQLPSGEEVQVNIGRYGPYARYDDQFVSLKKDDDPYTIDLARVAELVAAKKAAIEAATLRVFGDTGIRVVKGRFGPYITDGKRRARLPKGRSADDVSVFECEAYLHDAEAAKTTRGHRGGAKKGNGSAEAKARTGTGRKSPRATSTAARKPAGRGKRTASTRKHSGSDG
ncbi:MAG TPA: type I DNA topoisomerase [Nevskiaceae bacterium]